MNPAIEATVERHLKELNALAADDTITYIDRDRIGFMMGNIGQLVEMSDKAWETLQRFVTESRAVWKEVEASRE
jgi:hypothetical protein